MRTAHVQSEEDVAQSQTNVIFLTVRLESRFKNEFLKIFDLSILRVKFSLIFLSFSSGRGRARAHALAGQKRPDLRDEKALFFKKKQKITKKMDPKIFTFPSRSITFFGVQYL